MIMMRNWYWYLWSLKTLTHCAKGWLVMCCLYSRCNCVCFFSCQLRIEHMALSSSVLSYPVESWRAAFSCSVWIFSLSFCKMEFWHDNRVMPGFAADSIEHFLVKGISFLPKFMCAVWLSQQWVWTTEKQEKAADIPDIAQCLLWRHSLTLVSKKGK